MRASRFTVSRPIAGTGETFLFNSLTDTQIVVSNDVLALMARAEAGIDLLDFQAREAVDQLAELGFLVESREAEDAALEAFFREVREDASHLRLTLLTTLQCNFACDYCIQGDHTDHHNGAAARMSLDTAATVATWLEDRLDTLAPGKFTITFFGGEPLLNLPVVYALAERLSAACRARGVAMAINLITNGLLLTEAVVDRLLPLGLTGVKITLDGDKATHDRLRPLRGGQGTFDRILANMTAVAPKVRLSIGGNFDVESAETYPDLLAFLRAQPFADRIVKVGFKPIIRGPNTGRPVVASVQTRPDGRRAIPLTPVTESPAPLGGTCMTAAGNGGGTSSPCDSCQVVDERMSWLRAETRASGFETPDGLHMGPCELHRRHAYTIGPEGSLYPCPGFTGEPALRIGHVEPDLDQAHVATRERFDSHAPWRACGDCALVPVCGGGCSVAAHNEQGDLGVPSCHRPSMLAALDDIAASAQ